MKKNYEIPKTVAIELKYGTAVMTEPSSVEGGEVNPDPSETFD